MTDAEVIAAIQRCHLKSNIAQFEEDPKATIVWSEAVIDRGGAIFEPGPYLHVRVWRTDEPDTWIVRVYPPARLRRRLRRALGWD